MSELHNLDLDGMVTNTIPVHAVGDTGFYTGQVINNPIPSISYPTKLRICGNEGKLMVEIDLNTFEHTFGPEYEPDEAARIFWDAVSGYRK